MGCFHLGCFGEFDLVAQIWSYVSSYLYYNNPISHFSRLCDNVIKPYLKDYTSPKFKQFNGKISDARENAMKFVEILKVAGLDDDLKLKELSESLTEKPYTWYVSHTLGFVESWSQMCPMFEKFFSTQEKVTLVDLGKEYRKSRKDLMKYIQCFRERVLDIQESQCEKKLVKVCIEGMFNEYRLHV
ncbi:H0502G05.11 protein [Theobroma cacao]|uniref:H0502G05.11 protein n=1 Tax=Theobroma cacao TaxID=3641 RepID=A0A061GSL2_THECC|nr:H0502G05.11 protein [Theobroma cacao]